MMRKKNLRKCEEAQPSSENHGQDSGLSKIANRAPKQNDPRYFTIHEEADMSMTDCESVNIIEGSKNSTQSGRPCVDNHDDQSRSILKDVHVEGNSSPSTVNDSTVKSKVQWETECDKEDLKKIQASKNLQASWKDINAFKALIYQWKAHEKYFQSSAITNDKVWEIIAAELKKENPNWSYTGSQCCNKFKDGRKNYTKAKDANVNQSGQPTQSCTCYDEFEEVLGEKPLLKPFAIASNLKKTKLSKSLNEPCDSAAEISDEENDKDGEEIEHSGDKKGRRRGPNQREAK